MRRFRHRDARRVSIPGGGHGRWSGHPTEPEEGGGSVGLGSALFPLSLQLTAADLGRRGRALAVCGQVRQNPPLYFSQTTRERDDRFSCEGREGSVMLPPCQSKESFCNEHTLAPPKWNWLLFLVNSRKDRLVFFHSPFFPPAAPIKCNAAMPQCAVGADWPVGLPWHG